MAVDIGNTHTVVGLFKENQLLDHWRISSNFVRTEDELGALITFLFEKKGYSASVVNGFAISSVVPNLTEIYRYVSKRYFQQQAFIINSESNHGLIIKYKDPKAVGADRLCDAVAGIEKYGKPLIVLDFGTATTFDCINEKNEYLGGLISPGIQTTLDALHQKAAKLPQVDFKFPDTVIGRTTEESIQSGLFFGTAFMVDGLITELKKELGDNSVVVATGGYAGMLSQKIKKINYVDKYLSLDGINLIYKKTGS